MELVDVVALAIDGLQRGGGGVEVVAAHHSVLLVDAYDREEDAVDAHLLIDGSFAMLEEVLAVFVADDDDLPLLTQVDIVDEASLHQLHGIHLLCGRLGSLQGHVAQVVLAEGGRGGCVADLGDDQAEFVGEVAECRLAVGLVQLDATSLLDAVVGFRGDAGMHMDGIEREALAGLLKGVDDAIARSLQDDDQKQAVCHSERPQFVTAQ